MVAEQEYDDEYDEELIAIFSSDEEETKESKDEESKDPLPHITKQ